MTVETFSLGSLATNAYVVATANADSDCWVFDCPDEPEALIEALRQRRWAPLTLFLTHAHVDHMAGLNAFRRVFPQTKFIQHRLEAAWLADPNLNLSAWMGEAVTADPADAYVSDHQICESGGLRAEVLLVPGHSPGSVAYWFADEEVVVSGDVLFRSGVGRWDFPGSDRDTLRRSLTRLMALPDGTRVYPGHGGSTTIGREKTSNPYLRSEEPWL